MPDREGVWDSPNLPGTLSAIVRFRAPVTVTSGALDYSLKAVNPGNANANANAIAESLDRHVRRGSTVSWPVGIPACTRHATLTIYLNGATATSQPWRINAPAIATIASVRLRLRLRLRLPTVRRVPWC